MIPATTHAADSPTILIQDLHLVLPGFSLTAVNLSIEAGEFFILIGPTGAGKSLILESIVGAIGITSGSIFLDGRNITHLPPEKRRVGIVYQDQALFPHLSVRQNITYGLRYCRDRNALQKRLADLVEQLSLGNLLERSPVNLSGGEKQRVALARALVVQPSVLLLDEPLSALDPNFRDETRALIKQLHRDTGITALMVTHDFAEAHFLAQRVAVINEGRIEQNGTLDSIFYTPKTRFVADFVGMRNIFPAVFNNGHAVIETLSLRMNKPPATPKNLAAIRPEDIHILPIAARSDENGANRFAATVRHIINKGIYCDIVLKSDQVRFCAMMPTSEMLNRKIAEDDCVTVSIDPAKIHAL
jgi:molybdate/tungstate transport system ATP-binding protein